MVRRILAVALSGACLWPNGSAFSAAPLFGPPRAVSPNEAQALRPRSTDGAAEQSAPYNDGAIPDRRFVLRTASGMTSFFVALTAASIPANAGIDPTALRAFPVEGDTTGAASRLRNIESATGPRPEDSQDIAFEVLPSGASYREYREGKGDATVKIGSNVAAEMTIRCKSFATANEPGGVKYFSTKDDTEFNELAWTIGAGELPPDLEEGMAGMRRGALRRVELPSTAVFAARKNGQLPLPSEGNKEGRRRFDNLFKTDATLLFEVLVTRIK